MVESASDRPALLTADAPSGPLYNFRADRHPTLVAAWNQSDLRLDDGATHFGFIQSGQASLSTGDDNFSLRAGMYFAVPVAANIEGSGRGFVASRIDYRGFLHIGGPIEPTGRLRYIDGCTDSLLIAPVMKGDACLNLLHIPPGTSQTAHTHPSLRVGMIVGGEGLCRTSDGDVPLSPGLVFVIQTNGLHSFHTQQQPLLIVAWHPDSDFGPTHEQHPMLNRTLVEGRPVNMKGEQL